MDIQANQSQRSHRKLDGEGQGGEYFFFTILADTQFGFFERDDNYESDIRQSKKMVSILNELKPRFAVVCGDLTNMLPEIYSTLPVELRERQIRDFKAVFSELRPDIPLVCVCGNHDVGNRPTEATIARFRNDFGDDYFSYVLNDVRFVCLNSNVISDPTDIPAAYDEQLKWLEGLFQESKKKNQLVIVFGHHPLFLRDDDEATKDDTLGFDHLVDVWTGNPFVLPRSYFHIPLERRLSLMELFARYDVHWYFCGHFHRNVVKYSSRFQLNHVITTAVGRALVGETGYRLVAVNDHDVYHKYFSFTHPVPSPPSLEDAKAWPSEIDLPS